jgi:hypothetical protein
MRPAGRWVACHLVNDEPLHHVVPGEGEGPQDLRVFEVADQLVYLQVGGQHRQQDWKTKLSFGVPCAEVCVPGC